MADWHPAPHRRGPGTDAGSQRPATVDKTRVIAVEVPDRPGGLGEALHALRGRGINVEYMYSAARKSGERAIVIFRVDEIAKAVDALREAGVKVLDRLERI
jgi:hypothetical protein